jgi:F-type H+-transporting ATPase subunit alpha
VAIIYLGTKGLLTSVPVNKIKAFEEEYVNYLDASHRSTLDEIRAGKFTDEITKVLETACKELSAKYAH